MAVLRNLVIGVLSRAGPVNLTAALRRHARNPRRPLATLGINLGRNRHHDRTTEPWDWWTPRWSAASSTVGKTMAC